MSLDQKESVIRRKAQSGLNDHQARAMSVPKALRVSLAKVADELLDLAMSAIGVTSETLAASDCEALMEPASLLILLDGPDRKIGAMVLDPALVGALIQQQTMGKVWPIDDAAAPRALTATDAAMCAPFLDTWLSRAAQLPETDVERCLLEGYRFGARAENSRLMMMALEEPDYRTLRLTIDIAGGSRQGKLDLILPDAPAAATLPGQGQCGSGEAEAPAPKLLGDMVMSLHAELTVALTKMRLPLSQITKLAKGDTLTLNVNTLSEAIVLTAEGKQISSGTLGQVNGLRALKVERPKKKGLIPQRRAEDRTALQLPQVAPLFDTPDASEFKQSNLPGNWNDAENDTLPDLPNLPDLPEASDLPDLPDMSDLPELSGMDDLPDFDLKAG